MSGDWPEYRPLNEHKLPGFPVEALPATLAKFVEALAESYQVPIDLPASLALATVAAAVGGRYQVCVTPDWAEPLNLYIAVAMEPGSRKSAIHKLVTAPLMEFEAEIRAAATRSVDAIEEERMAIQGEIDRLRKKAASANPDDREAALDRIGELKRQLPEAPAAPRLIVDDVTPEALTSILANSRGELALCSAEGGVFDTIAGRYNRGVPNLDVFLKAHAGDPIRVDRTHRASESIDSPCLVMCLCIQRSVIATLAQTPGFEARGFVARWLFALPESNIGFRRLETPRVPLSVSEAYRDAIYELLFRCERQEHRDVTRSPNQLLLSSPAMKRFSEFRLEVELAMRPDGDLADCQGWGSKLPGATARIAGLLHLIETRGAPQLKKIQQRTIEAAIEIGTHFRSHALPAFALMGQDTELSDAMYLEDRIRAQEIRSFSKSELHQRFRSRFRKSCELVGPIRILFEHGMVRVSVIPRPAGPGRPPSPRYEVNPCLFVTRPKNSDKARTAR